MVQILDVETFWCWCLGHLNAGVGMSLIYITKYFGMTLTPPPSQLGIVYLVTGNIVFLDITINPTQLDQKKSSLVRITVP